MTEHRIVKITDLLDLSPEEFARMLPDLQAWVEFARPLKACGADSVAFIWFDDGKPGVLSRTTITFKATGGGV